MENGQPLSTNRLWASCRDIVLALFAQLSFSTATGPGTHRRVPDGLSANRKLPDGPAWLSVLPVIRGQFDLASQHGDSALCSREDS